MSFIIDCYSAGVSNEHCLLSLFSLLQVEGPSGKRLSHHKDLLPLNSIVEVSMILSMHLGLIEDASSLN